MRKCLSYFLAFLMLFALCMPALAAESEAQEAAETLYELGLFKGTGTDAAGKPVFDLGRAPTRAEAVTMLVRLLGKEEDARSGSWEIPFTDVANWAKPYVGYAYANGLTTGVSETRFGGSVTDRCTCYIASLDFDFLERVSAWIKEHYPDGQISGTFSRETIRAVEYVSNGRYRLSISCAQNKAGIAAKAALFNAFFDESGRRFDMDADAEKAKILRDIERGKAAAHSVAAAPDKETKTMLIYRDPATGWLYRVSPQPENGIYAMQYRDPANSVVWKPDITWNTNAVYRDREHLQEGLEARAKRDGWELVSGPASSEPPEVVDEGEEYSPCDTCRCPDCIDSSCPQAGCDKTDGGFGCFAPYEECPAPAEKTWPDEHLVKDKISDCCYFSGVTSHLIGSKLIENVNCACEDHPLSIDCYTFGCKGAVETCRSYWLGQIDEKLGHRVPEHLFKDGSANDLRAYLEEEIEKCKNQSARNGDAAATTVGNAVPETMETPTTPTDANTLPAPGCPADAGSATQSLSAAGPASLEAEPEATPFDYSGLDAQTVADLHLAEREYLGGRKLAEMGLRRMADGVAIAHDALCGGCDNLSQAHNNQYSKDTFGAWCGSIGIHRKAAERLLQVSKLLDNSTPREQKVLEELTPSVLYEASRPSAEPEAVEALKSKQVKTLKEFRALEAQIKAEREAREKAVAEAESLRYANDALRDEAATARAQAKHAQEKADALETRPVMSELFDAKERIKELEARPVEVAVQEPDPAEVERRAGEKAREMTAMLQAQVRGMQEDLDDARKIIDSAESATYMAAAEFAVNAAQVLNGIRASFWAVAKELSDEDFSSAAAPLLEAANRIVDCEWDDDEEEQE